MPVSLDSVVRKELGARTPPAIRRFAEALAQAPGAVAVMFYGSTLRTGDLTGLLDFYVLTEEPQLIDRLWENTRFFKAGLGALGFDTGQSESPITPVIVGDAALAMRLSDRLFESGVFAQGIGLPTVPRGKARVRTIVTATHTREELDFALDAFKTVGTELGLV